MFIRMVLTFFDSGATGFVGTEVTRAYVDAGYSVRGTARSQQKVAEWEEFNPEYKDRVECLYHHHIVVTVLMSI